MSWFWWIVLLAVAALVAAIVNGFLAPLQVHFRSRDGDPSPAPVAPDGPFVGLALSGGGARAAVFAAAGMEALHARGLLDEVTHVSSVSGGGFAAAYLALHTVPKGDASGYFADMQAVMAHDYFWETQVKQATKPARMFSPSRRLTSLTEGLARPDFVGQATFADLPRDRAFFFNTVCYDTGQRFTLSNAVLPPPGHPAQGLPDTVRTLSFSDAKTLRATPDAFPVTLAVATSAAFPPYLGPTTLQVDAADGAAAQYWHLGDGGVVENPGVESLREAIHARPDAAPATIYSFDAGKRLDGDLSRNTHDISIWSRDVTRLVDVVVTYAGFQRAALGKALDAQTGRQIDTHVFDYMEVVHLADAGEIDDPKWLPWSGWPHVTAKDRLESRTPAAHLAKIPTALKINPLNQHLIAEAARYLVNKRFPLVAD